MRNPPADHGSSSEAAPPRRRRTTPGSPCAGPGICHGAEVHCPQIVDMHGPHGARDGERRHASGRRAGEAKRSLSKGLTPARGLDPAVVAGTRSRPARVEGDDGVRAVEQQPTQRGHSVEIGSLAESESCRQRDRIGENPQRSSRVSHFDSDQGARRERSGADEVDDRDVGADPNSARARPRLQARGRRRSGHPASRSLRRLWAATR